MTDEDILYKADLKFYDNIIIDTQNAKKELEEIKQPLLKALHIINRHIESLDKTIDKYVEKKKKTENDYLRYSETSSTSSS